MSEILLVSCGDKRVNLLIPYLQAQGLLEKEPYGSRVGGGAGVFAGLCDENSQRSILNFAMRIKPEHVILTAHTRCKAYSEFHILDQRDFFARQLMFAKKRLIEKAPLFFDCLPRIDLILVDVDDEKIVGHYLIK